MQNTAAEIEVLEGLVRYCFTMRRGSRQDIAVPALNWEIKLTRELERIKNEPEPEPEPRRLELETVPA